MPPIRDSSDTRCHEDAMDESPERDAQGKVGWADTSYLRGWSGWRLGLQRCRCRFGHHYGTREAGPGPTLVLWLVGMREPGWLG